MKSWKRKTVKKETRKTEKQNINVDWLEKRLKDRDLSKADFCRAIKMPIPTFSKVLAHHRDLQIPELVRISRVLDEPLDELFVRLNLIKPDELRTSKDLPLEGWLGDRLILTKPSAKNPIKPPRTVSCPFTDRFLRVVRAETAGTEFAGWDGTLVFYRELQGPDARPSQFVGAKALVQVEGEEAWRLRVIRKSYSREKYNLTLLDGKVMEENVTIVGIHPVLHLDMTV